MATLEPSLIGSSSFLQVMRTDEFEIWPDRQWTAEIAALERLKKSHQCLQWEKCCDHSNAFIFDWNFFILAGNKGMHKSLVEFESKPDQTTDYGVTCP